MAQTVALTDVLSAAIGAELDRVMTSLPGYVESYDPVLGVVDVQPAVVDTYTDENGDEVQEAFPIVTCVPVMFEGVGSCSITYPIKKGDPCLLEFCCRSLDAFWALGHGSRPINPRTRQRHHISDAVAKFGLRSKTQAIKPPPPNDAMVLTAPKLKLGGPVGTSKVVVQTALDHFGAALVQAQTDCLASDPLAAPALAALITALGLNPTTGTGWSAGTTKTEAL